MRRFTCDFETTTDENDCRVWAYALFQIGSKDNFLYGNSIDDLMEWCKNQKDNVDLYFHNLKFDGCFICYWLETHGFTWVDKQEDCGSNNYTTLITDMGAWYSIEIYFKVHGHHTNKVRIFDSLKLLNFSVADIAKGFGLPISKLELDYSAYRAPGHKLTPHEVDYIRNDVEIVARALDVLFKQGHTKMTISSNALANFKKLCPRFKTLFPVLPLDIDFDIRSTYKGGFTYLNPIYKEKETGSGYVMDVNSLYPSVMASMPTPYDVPIYFDGRYVEDEIYPLYTQTITCRFKVKPGKIPSIQVKSGSIFAPNEYIEDSGDDPITLALTRPDIELFFEQYDVFDIHWGGGYKFKSAGGVFSSYIQYWSEQKIKAKKEGIVKEEVSDEEHQVTVPMAVLINGNTASAAELFSGAIQDYHLGYIVGQTSYGKGVVQSIFRLNDGSGMKFTTETYYTPSGRCVDGEGVIPDYPVEISEEAYEDGVITDEEDLQLQKAIELLSGTQE